MIFRGFLSSLIDKSWRNITISDIIEKMKHHTTTKDSIIVDLETLLSLLDKTKILWVIISLQNVEWYMSEDSEKWERKESAMNLRTYSNCCESRQRESRTNRPKNK